MPPIRHPLTGQRWHLQHGPIDLVIGAEGDPDAVAAAHAAAWLRFQDVLKELVAELPLLRRPVAEDCPLQGVVARRMWRACHPHRQVFITPMAAVAGAVAEEIIAAYRRDGVERAWVNNGGDIALHLAPGRAVRVGLFADLARAAAPPQAPSQRPLQLDGRFEVQAGTGVRGVATSGWRGRSFSLGIADSVTVLAATAAVADAAATVIANAVNVDDARVQRQPAHSLKDDSDLGAIEVTVHVPPLPGGVVQDALHRGVQRAQALCASGLVRAAILCCQGKLRLVDDGAGLLTLIERSGAEPAPALA
jgi:ApbE superfamily uncharacterized protein (UPF0280 family)